MQQPSTPERGGSPSHVTIREGVPTRVDLAGGRYRFAIHSSDASRGVVRFSARIDGHSEAYVVAVDDLLDAGGHSWRVSEVDAGSPTRVRLEQVPAPGQG